MFCVYRNLGLKSKKFYHVSSLYLFCSKHSAHKILFTNFSCQPHKFTKGQSLSIGLENPLYTTRDVKLYSNNNNKFYRALNLFSFMQFVFWGYLSHIAYSTMKDTPVSAEELEHVKKSLSTDKPLFVPIWRELNLGKYKDYLSAFCGTVGSLALIITLLYTRNCVKALTLYKGGEKIKLEFFSLLGRGKQISVPLSDVSAKSSRQNSRSYVILQLRGRKLYLLLDQKGEFSNKELFDRTVGLRRAWAK